MAIPALAATPLVSVDAVAIDLETTGLDPRRARIVQIGALGLASGAGSAEFTILVDPEAPIPREATLIHGLSDDDVRGARRIGAALSAFDAFVADRPVVGHAVGFDLAVFAAERRRAGHAAATPRALDTRLLAELVAPALPAFDLETIAAWLDLPVEGRHSAIGDARTAARIFRALLPHLRGRGIRTWGEAERACRDLRQGAGPLDPAAAPPVEADADPAGRAALERIDSFPYRHRVGDLMAAPPETLPPTADLAAAVRRMAERGIGSVFVTADASCRTPECGAETVRGIVTERDVLRVLHSRGAAGLSAPLADTASFPLWTVRAGAFVYRAMGRMDRLGVRHLGVVDDAGRLVGALSVRDLLRLRGSAALRLGDAVDVAPDIRALGQAWAQLPDMAEALLAEDVPATGVAAVIARELGAATRRAAQLAEASLEAEGRRPPCPYALLVLGSAGRGESLLAHDQDNAVVFATGAPDSAADLYFAELGRRVVEILDSVGIVRCRGGVMAERPEWRGSVATWRDRIGGWLRRSDPRDLLSVDIFFDARVVHGDADIAEGLLSEARADASGAVAFLKLLAGAAPEPPRAVGPFGGVRTEAGRLDLKLAGLLPIVGAARVLALRHGVGERATPERLAAVRALRRGGEADLAAAEAAQLAFVDAILRQQIADIRNGLTPSSRVEFARRSKEAQRRLKQGLNTASGLGSLVRELLF